MPDFMVFFVASPMQVLLDTRASGTSQSLQVKHVFLSAEEWLTKTVCDWVNICHSLMPCKIVRTRRGWSGSPSLNWSPRTSLGCLESKPAAMTCNEVTCSGKQWYPCASWIGSFVQIQHFVIPDINWIHHECTVQVRRKLGRAQAIIGLESPGIRYTWCIENTVTVNSFAIPKLPGSRVAVGGCHLRAFRWVDRSQAASFVSGIIINTGRNDQRCKSWNLKRWTWSFSCLDVVLSLFYRDFNDDFRGHVWKKCLAGLWCEGSYSVSPNRDQGGRMKPVTDVFCLVENSAGCECWSIAGADFCYPKSRQNLWAPYLQRILRAGGCSKSNESTVNPKADPSHQLHWLLCLGSLSEKTLHAVWCDGDYCVSPIYYEHGF